MKDELPFGSEPKLADPTPAPPSPAAATSLYAAEPTRSGVVHCGVCKRENHETRVWCTACGHQLGVALAECVCEGCLKA